MKPQAPQLIGITMGDPSGIGPEVMVKAIQSSKLPRDCRFKIIGDYVLYQRYSSFLPKNCTFVDLQCLPLKKWRIGKPNRLSGKASLAYLEKAVELLKKKEISSLVTAPVSKEAVAFLKPSFQGHTEFLAEAFGIKEAGMMFVADKFRTILVTRHIPLKAVSKTITTQNIYSTLNLTHRALIELFKIKRPCIAVCGLNPHAGEKGLLGKEEIKKIIPAIQKARKNKMNIIGPMAADTLFLPEKLSRYDAVAAMYHDQGLIPMKALYFRKVVNLTIGLPFIRTSPAHGTAFDIAGKDMADPSSMIEAIQLAACLSP